MQRYGTIDFYGQTITVIKHDDVPYVAVKPIVESLGLDIVSQRQKIREDPRFNGWDIPSVAHDGKQRLTLCIPLKKLNAFLFSINPNKVHPDRREMLEHYQEECAAALFNYWTFGYALNPRLVTPAQQALFQNLSEQHGEISRQISVSDAHKFLLLTQAAGVAPSRLALLNRVKRGTLRGHKTDAGWMIERAAFDDYVRRLKLQM